MMQVNSVRKINSTVSIIVFALVLVIGIAFLTLFLTFKKGVPENYVETQAKITRIEEELLPYHDESDGIGPDDYEYRVFVEYSYNDKTFSDVEYGNYDSSMKQGDLVALFLNPDDPSEFMSDQSGDFVFIIIGIVIILVSAGGLGLNIYKKKKEKQ